jgi:hypothetical protein
MIEIYSAMNKINVVGYADVFVCWVCNLNQWRSHISCTGGAELDKGGWID